MIYEYIVTAFKVVVGLVSNNIIAIAGIVALGLMIVWVIASLLTSYQYRFSLRARKLNKFALSNGLEGENKVQLKFLLSKMPTEFYRGYSAFERDPNSLPSQYIKRFESLEMEVSGGVFNQNKSILRTYTNFIFVSLLLLSFGLVSNQTLTGYLVAEAFLLPLAFLFLAKIVYYVYTAIRQYQYRVAVEDFNELVDCLDKVAMQTYGYNPTDRFDQKLEVIRPATQTYEQVNEVEPVEELVVEQQPIEEQEVQEKLLEKEGQTNENSAKVEKVDLESLKALQEEVKQESEQIAKKEKDLEDIEENANVVESNIEEESAEFKHSQDLEENEPEQEEVYETPVEDVAQIQETSVEDGNDNQEKYDPVEEINFKEHQETVVQEETREQSEANQEVEATQVEAPQLVEIDESQEDVVLRFNFSGIKKETKNNRAEKPKEQVKNKEVKKQEKNAVSVSDNFKPDFASLFDEDELVEAPKRGRGRPKKVVTEDGEFVIHNDKEFEDALVRAEKLMRKNEEPLSASQTKRIEKQLKELIDAMTKYKEGK